ncbi:MAG: hypothetical protein IKO27_09385 [Ruminococcus sp.]|nr:hypothetical protein [Ruminococcus sp.]
MKNQFRGFYFKVQNKTQTVAVIAAQHCSGDSGSSSVQVITDTGTYNIPYPMEAYKQSPKGFQLTLGENYFTEKGMNLDIDREGIRIRGRVKFGRFSKPKYDIMGPFALLPFMECRHTVVSLRHRVDGWINVNGEEFVFSGDTGYIEGDSGRSFPSEYSWTQCSFDRGSLMLSVADIPVGPLHFTGVIGFVLLDGTEYRIGTYLLAKPSQIRDGEIVIDQGHTRLTARLIEKNALPLAAPVSGSMVRTIHESASCKAFYKLSRRGRILTAFTSDRASFEYEYGE